MIAPLLLSIYSDGISGYLVLITGAVIVVLFFTIIGTLALKERVNKEVVGFRKGKKLFFKRSSEHFEDPPGCNPFCQHAFYYSSK